MHLRTMDGRIMNPPDLVRIETVRYELDEGYEGAAGLLIDTDIDLNGHGIYTVHIPAQNRDIQAREVTVLSKANRVRD